MSDDWQAWVGKTEQRADTVTAKPVRAMSATLLDKGSLARPGDPLPPLWHWLYFLPVVPMREVGPDGHPKKGGFLPPVPLERRMWAGGRLKFYGILSVGDDITRQSEILSISEKPGQAGNMVFVTVKHQISGPRGLAIEEEQDIVYLPMPTEFRYPKPVPIMPETDWRVGIEMDPVRLFRFSALTFNGHRIHYDRHYAAEVEKYPGLVVHGPFQAMILMAQAQAHHSDRTVSGFRFRGIRPVFDHDQIEILGKTEADDSLTVVTATGDGFVGMKASVDWA